MITIIEKGVLEKITPSKREDEEAQIVVDELKEKVIEIAKKLKIENIVEPILVGSVAKGTYLKNPDIDLFLMFPQNTSRENLEKYGLRIGKEIIKKGEKRYAEHPYTHGNYKGFGIDIVPCYKIKDPSRRMSAVDRTPFHTKYIKENLEEEQKGDVRLLKQFLKGIGIYGAEAEIEGLSGYLCELLILKYGTFHNLLKNASKWKKGTIIKLKGEKAKVFDEFPLIVIDPIDPSRNVASALSLDNFCTFIHASKEYLKNKRMEFFFPNHVKPLPQDRIMKMMRDRGTTFLALTFHKPNIIHDILYPQLRKCEKSIIQLCESNDFKINHSKFFVNNNVDEVLFIFEVENSPLPPLRKHYGPPVWHKNTREFLEKWKKKKYIVYVENGYWMVDIEREHTQVEDLIKANITILNLGKNINNVVKKEGFKILKNEKIVRKSYLEYLTIFLERKFRWEY